MSDLSPIDNEKLAFIALSLVPRVGGRTLNMLLERFGSAQAVLQAPESELLSLRPLQAKTVLEIKNIDLEESKTRVEEWQAMGITLLTWLDELYPPPLLSFHSRPSILFARGQLEQQWERVVAIVGTREPDKESITLTETLAAELAGRGWLISSGLALGVDAAAHRGALAEGRTVAMLGSGLSKIFPPENFPLTEQILEQGAIYAEVLPSQKPLRGTLMARNRLIAAVAKATIVMQAGPTSGSLEAARQARQNGRAVLTLDHPDYSGNKELLRAEAIPLSPENIDFDELHKLLDNLPPPPQQMSLFS